MHRISHVLQIKHFHYVIRIIDKTTIGGVMMKWYPISMVTANKIKLNDGFWGEKINTIRKTSINHGFEKCKSEGRLENFLIAGGKMNGKVRGQMPFDDTDVYKIVEGASNALLNSPDEKLSKYLDEVIETIGIGQEKDGYITTWFTIDPLNPPYKWIEKTGKRWAGEISSHELYNSGHLIEAACVHHEATGKRNLLDIAIKNADLLVENFGPGKHTIPPGHQIVETGLVKLYRITGNEKYAELAKYFLELRGNPQTHKLFGDYSQDHKPVVKQTEAVGHAVRAVYMYAAMTDMAAIYDDRAYQDAVNAIWDNTFRKKTYITGGIGSRHDKESFGDEYELPNTTAYCETCAAIGSILWNQRLFMLTGNSIYFDIIERSLFNGVIPGMSLDGTKFFYVNPLEADNKFVFNRGAGYRQEWFDCSCCPTNIIRFIPAIPGLLYAVSGNDIFVNLFASGSAGIGFNGSKINVVQRTDYPWKGDIKITVNPEKESEFNLKIRIPGWVTGKIFAGDLYNYLGSVNKQYTIKINGVEEHHRVESGYVTINKKWKKNDRIDINFPMEIRRVISSDKILANRNLSALEYGPLVYCVEEIDNPLLNDILMPDDAVLSVERKNDLLGEINIIKGKVPAVSGNKHHDLFAIPYYAWANRTTGAMKIWLPRS